MARKLHVLIEGMVQGVGFRHATLMQARGLGLTGWVRNTRDGRVEAEFEGAEDELETMLNWCQKGPGLASVTNVEFEWNEGESEHDNFDIRF